MPARKPEECDTLLAEAINRGDIESAVALYEPNAAFVAQPGQVVVGHAGVREAMKAFVSLKPTLKIEVNAIQNGGGDVALLRSKWSLTGTGSDGKPMTMSGNGTEVVRKQADGAWLFIIDNPSGAD
ncbi:MAG: SgcJ/EcaC family oxidoreductase [Candidatus Binatia bacterium]